MKRIARWSLLGVVLTAWTSGVAFGSPVGGELNVTGDARVGTTFITFLCSLTSPVPCPANYGNFSSTGVQSGDFVPYANQGGYIESLNVATAPINQAFLLSNFLYFAASASLPQPDIALDLTYIYAGVYGQAQCGAAPAAGQTCTPVIPALVTPANPAGLSPFNLTNTSTGSSASFSVSGLARRVSTGEVSPFNGTFTTQFTSTPGTSDASYQSLLATLAAGGTISKSYSTTFTAAPVPEPTSIGLLGLGLAWASRQLRKRR